MALKTYTGIMTDGSFNKAVNDVFAGITARQDQLQQLLVVAFAKAQQQREDGTTVDDFRWLSTILAKAIETKGLNSKRMADWINSCVSSPDTDRPLKYEQKTAQLKKSKAGIKLVYNVQGTWYDYGKPDDVQKSFAFAQQLESLLKRASKAYNDGLMSDSDKQAYEEFLNISRTAAEPDGAVSGAQAVAEMDAAIEAAA